MSASFPVSGLKGINDYLSALPKNMKRNAGSAGLRAAAKEIQNEAQLRAAKDTGTMARGIKYGGVHNNQDGTLSIRVRLTGKHAFLGLFHEYGVQPHYLNAGDSKLSARKVTQAALNGGFSDVKARVLVIDGKFISGLVLHPGFAPHPFMRPALDAKAADAVEAFASRIRSYVAGVKEKTGYDVTAGLSEAA